MEGVPRNNLVEVLRAISKDLELDDNDIMIIESAFDRTPGRVLNFDSFWDSSDQE